MGRRAWTDDQLRAAAASARCLADVLRALGNAHSRTVHRRAAALGIEIPSGKPPTWNDDEFRMAVASSTTVREVLQRLSVAARGGNYKTFHRHVQRLGLDTSHFVGSAHLAGKARANLASRRPLDTILVEHGSYENTNRLAERLLREGVLERRCAGCHRTEWQGRPIPLELDHVNGVRRDLRRENLRLLCPNCHALTPTYRGKNITRGRRTA